MKRGFLLILSAGILGAAAGWAFNHLFFEDRTALAATGEATDQAESQSEVRFADHATGQATDQAASPAGPVGQRRPDFTLGSANGERVSASDFDGQVVLLNFWATWCAPCREEMPMLSALHDEYQSRGVQIVGIALDDVAQAREFLQELGIAYTNLVGTVDVMALGRVYGNQAGLLPYSVLVDRSGVVRQTWLGVLDEVELKEWFEKLL